MLKSYTEYQNCMCYVGNASSLSIALLCHLNILKTPCVRYCFRSGYGIDIVQKMYLVLSGSKWVAIVISTEIKRRTPDGAGQLQVACSSKWTIPSQKGPQFSQSPNFYTFY
ncbi:unnamed protein product [Fusarium graminearum]|nr:unnamed protein product [Fusarium graminearum]